jgi:death on curing protein
MLSIDDVLQIHQDQIARYGGSPDLRDPGLLQSALAQPQAMFGGEWLHTYPFEMAAAYLFHVVKNHPFVDGNKRTGAVAGLLFLELNGVELQIPTGQLSDITIAVACGEMDKAGVAAFFQTHATSS